MKTTRGMRRRTEKLARRSGIVTRGTPGGRHRHREEGERGRGEQGPLLVERRALVDPVAVTDVGERAQLGPWTGLQLDLVEAQLAREAPTSKHGSSSSPPGGTGRCTRRRPTRRSGTSCSGRSGRSPSPASRTAPRSPGPPECSSPGTGRPRRPWGRTRERSRGVPPLPGSSNEGCRAEPATWLCAAGRVTGHRCQWPRGSPHLWP